MELTQFVVDRRNDALSVGDYGTYRKSLSRRILTIRRRLGRTTTKGRKYTQKASITAEDVAGNEEFIHLQVLTAERAWAHAMYMKSMRSNDSDQAITGSTKTHILSRLEKARKVAAHLADILGHATKPVGDGLLLEAQAYQTLISGALAFEARKWSKSLEDYSVTHLIYSTLLRSSDKKTEAFQELLTNTVEPSIRYAAYQTKVSRTSPIPQIISQNLKRDSPPIQVLLGIDPTCLDEQKDSRGEAGDRRDLPRVITWRTREVPIEDAAISEALANVRESEIKLSKAVTSGKLTAREKAVAYDDVLVPSQDAVDAAKQAIDELIAEGVPPSDRRLQALQMTRTALSYDLISRRIGRYRVLCGKHDGVDMGPSERKEKKNSRSENTGSKLAGLRERVVLYDSILQSLESINELPGVPADQVLGKELSSKKAYFSALRSISIARSHSIQGNSKNALALYASAAKNALLIATTDSNTSKDNVLGIEVTREQAELVQTSAKRLVAQQHALVEIHSIEQEEIKAEKSRRLGATPFIEHLNEYPPGGVDLANLVDYPPKIRPIPVKPIFLDVAWNHIKYPGKGREPIPEKGNAIEVQPAQPEKKRGWFGFSR